MPDWLDAITKPESLAVIGALTFTAGVIVRNFTKGLKEGTEAVSPELGVVPPSGNPSLTAIAATTALQTSMLRQLVELLEGMHAQLRLLIRVAEDNSDYLHKIERGQSESRQDMTSIARHIEAHTAIAMQVRDQVALMSEKVRGVR